jgi:hypothetical protein
MDAGRQGRHRVSNLVGRDELVPIFNGENSMSTFAIKDAEDFFQQIVVPYHQAFMANNASSAGALVTISMTYHLYEWANPKEIFTEVGFRQHYPGRPEMIDYFELARMLANGLKHFDPTKSSRAVTKAESGFSQEFSKEFARCLYVQVGIEKMIGDENKTADGWISADDLLTKMVMFWQEQHAAGRL